jgi:glycosyltransferase involved in cell wall biosynthesis
MPSKLKVLFDANPIIGQKTGVGYYTENLVKALANNHSQQIELTGYFFDFLSLGRFKPPAIPNINYKTIRWFPRKLLSLIRRIGFQIPLNVLIPTVNQFDLVFFPNFVSLPLFNNRNVVVVHDLCFIDHPEFVANANRIFLRRFVLPSLKRANAVVGISQFTKNRIADNFKALSAPVVVAPPGVGITPKFITEKKEQIRPVLFIGTIEPRKNIEHLIDAYLKLPIKLQKMHPLWIGGSKGWNNQDVLDRFERLQSQQLPIKYLGYISDKEKVKLYTQAAAVVLVSYYEGFGMPILEAMAFNKPLLLSDIPVFKEVAGPAAYYSNPSEVDDIARQLERTLTRPIPDRKYLYKEILHKYSWEKSASNVLQAFISVARGSND